jgi:hypothetical protein
LPTATPTPTPVVVENVVETIEIHVPETIEEEAKPFEEGIASFYGGSWIGKLTANGETYKKSDITAAHKTLPFGTIVKVVDSATGKSVDVRINNRGPYKAGRIIDLSEKAAEIIGLTPKKGLINVKLYIVSQPEQKPKAKGKTSGLEIIEFAERFVGLRETHGNNRSPEIDKWNKSAGSYLGAPYCASFVSYVLRSLGIDAPNSAWSPTMVSRNRIPFSDIEQGDVFWLTISHTGFIDNPRYTSTGVSTVEANTSPSSSLDAKDRDGDGVYRKLRNKKLLGQSGNKFSRYR